MPRLRGEIITLEMLTNKINITLKEQKSSRQVVAYLTGDILVWVSYHNSGIELKYK